MKCRPILVLFANGQVSLAFDFALWNYVKTMKISRILAVTVCGLLLYLLVGCERPSESFPVSENTGNAVLHRGNGGEPQTLDPSLAEDVHAFNVLRDLYEGLVTEAADSSLQSGVAERWEISDSGRRYTFHIRKEAKWSNGSAVTANDFLSGFHRTVAPDSASPYSFLLSPISNYEAVVNGERPVQELGVRVIDSHTLVIELTSPASYFLGVLAMPISFPQYSAEEFDPQRFGVPANFIGNGPYVLHERRPGFRIRLKRNPYFREASRVAIEYVDYLPIEDPDTELNMYRAGELDITATIPPARTKELRRDRPDEVSISPSLALYYLAFDLSEAPMNEIALRQALSMAIDRESLVNLIGRGEQAAFGIVPAGTAGHEVARFTWQGNERTDREALAQKFYSEAGYSAGNPLQFTLTYDVGDIHETVALAVASMWGDVLGAEVTLDKREWKYFLDTRDNRDDWQIMRFAWTGDYNDASTFLDIFRADNEQNLSGFYDSDYDELLDQASRETDAATRSKLMNRAEQHLLAEHPVIPLYFYVSKHLVNPAVRNFEANVLDVHPSRYLVKSTEQEPANQ